MSEAATAAQTSPPLKPPHKKLVICLDGTWNEPEEASEKTKFKEEPTNVLKVVRGVKPRDAGGVVQVAYYHTGVGTDAGLYDKWIGGALGVGLSADVQEAYRFVANNYLPGDRLYIFGFSRGAFAARSLAGFIGALGLLDKKRLAWLPEAYKLYRTPPDKRAASPYKKTLDKLGIEFAADLPIHFIGVWDTVGALGSPTPLLNRLSRRWVGFHDTDLGKNVKHAYHAIAVDERRRPFKADLWTARGHEKQVVEQVWFAGVHSNIGGSYRNRVLSDIALQWMVQRAEECGLEFKQHLHELTPEPVAAGRVENSFTFAYKVLRLLKVPPYDREIGDKQVGEEKGKPGVNERVHWSARQALESRHPIDHREEPGAPYGSENLRRAVDAKIPDWKENQRGRVWDYENEDQEPTD